MRLKLKQIIKKIRGSALGSVVLIGSSALGMIFAIWVSQYASNDVITHQGDSLQAYHSASAGIDLGLMYYKYNNNVQMSAKCENVNNDCTEEPTKTKGLPIRIFINRLGCAVTHKEPYNGEYHDGKEVDYYLKDPRDMSINEAGKRYCYGKEVGGSDTYTLLKDAKLKPPLDEQVVDLKIWYKDDQLGNPTKFNENFKTPNAFNSNYNYNPEISRVVQQDDSYQINGLEKVNTFKLHLRPKEWAEKRREFKIAFPGKLPEDRDVYNRDYYRNWFQKSFCNQQGVKTNIPNKDLCAYYIMKINSFERQNAAPMGNDIVPLRIPFDPWNSGGKTIKLGLFVGTVRLRPINMDLQFAITNVQDIFCTPNADAKTKKLHCNLPIDSGVTHIEATGYYGNAKRKLEAKYDRKDNAFLGIFDRALYVGEGGLAPIP